jgi:hypothetical protein
MHEHDHDHEAGETRATRGRRSDRDSDGGAAAALVWQADASDAELALTDAAPESAALARVVASYPDDAVLTSMFEQSRTDEFTTWDPR